MAPRNAAHGVVVTEISHRFVETNGIRMHVAEAGSGPLVLRLPASRRRRRGWPPRGTVLGPRA